jgi:opacity protein-like surface antigen
MVRINKFLGGAALATVLALSLEASAHVRTGAYVGLNVGYANLNPNAKVEDTLNDGAGDPGNGMKIDKHKGMLQANLLVGYEWMRPSNLILGTELAVGMGYSPSSKSYRADGPGTGTNDYRNYKIREQWKAGLYGLVGTSLTERVSLYGKLGILYSRFGSVHHSATATSGAPSSALRHHTNFWGLEPGIRVKVAMSEAWAATFDASYAFYQNKKETTFTTNNPDTQALKNYAPRMWGITAGLAYKF